MMAAITFLVKFVAALGVLIIACTVIWESRINGHLYVCTDPGFLDFLDPGDWVHKNYVEVDRFDHPRSMSEPDAVLKGWSKERLWFLWYGFVGLSVAISFVVAITPWTRKSTAT